jgi:hypothetical protein
MHAFVARNFVITSFVLPRSGISLPCKPMRASRDVLKQQCLDLGPEATGACGPVCWEGEELSCRKGCCRKQAVRERQCNCS